MRLTLFEFAVAAETLDEACSELLENPREHLQVDPPESPIQRLKRELRDIRIKVGCDYAIVEKYGKTRILCDAVWQDSIKEVAERCGITVNFWYTY